MSRQTLSKSDFPREDKNSGRRAKLDQMIKKASHGTDRDLFPVMIWEDIMKKLTSATLALMMIGGASFAGGYSAPIIEEPVIVEETAASSSPDWVVPILIIALIAAAASSSSGGSTPSPQ